MFERPYLTQLASRIKEPRRFIQVVVGPRQVGKTTLVTQLLKKTTLPNSFISADNIVSSNTTWLEQQWENARLKMDRLEAQEFLLVIDEIQKITNWSEVVKQLWDADTASGRQLKVILLGSSRVLLGHGLSESLAGRFETTYLPHWSYNEMNSAFGWEANQYVWFGGYPGSAALIEEEDRWKNYVRQSLIEPSISKDILMLTRVDKPALMKQLFELGCTYSGQILSYTKIMGQLAGAGNTTTLAHYVELLDTAGLLAGLEKYSRKKLIKRSSSPKWQVHNTALISSQSDLSFNEIQKQPSDWGRLVESAAGAHLVNYAAAGIIKLYYWREENEEVDFVIEKKGKLIGLEVKSSTLGSITGLGSFKKRFMPEKLLLIGSSGIPWQEFLSIHPSEFF